MNSSSKGVDTLLLCGDKGASRSVYGVSKSFIYMHGKPLFAHVLDALFKTQNVRRIFIIGNKQKLDANISQLGRQKDFPKPVITIEQDSNLIANIWSGFLATLGANHQSERQVNKELIDKVILVLPGDVPLISAAEVDDFLLKADIGCYDYVMGMTPSNEMAIFHSTGKKPGIKMASAYFREGSFRINNLHLARPFACKNLDAVQLLYNSRYQKNVMNMLRLTRDMWRQHIKVQSLFLYFLMQVSSLLAYLGLEKFNWVARRYVPMTKVAAAVGRILGMRAGFVITTAGGAALDVDNEADYETMKLRFLEWKGTQQF
ncbi:MAG TPA: NTP transferase domain-containing protein [Nitrospinota bacterium]|nr:NTP transferase domain-containing protein [Nitrospinota bacterium]|tara:strand:+ start:102126 stop:103076 length:951 start_codon:yes stop_codon:yes gene_type:complete